MGLGRPEGSVCLALSRRVAFAPMNEGSIAVVAHPDDEILWLSPVMPTVERVVVALPGSCSSRALTRARREIRELLPIEMCFSPLREAGVHLQSDWARRPLTREGVGMHWSCPPLRRYRYRRNYRALLQFLEPHVAQAGIVYTHNPWGEYGHEEHIQISRVVSLLAQHHGTSVWVWDGMTNDELLRTGCRTRLDHYTPLPSLRSQTLPVDREFYLRWRDVYMSRNAWTWADDYEPPPECRLLEVVREGELLLKPASALEAAPGPSDGRLRPSTA